MINEFITEVKTSGMARTNRYRVTFGRPPGLVTDSFSDDIKTISLFCTGAQLPGLNVDSAPHRIYSESREMPYGMSFTPLNLVFYTDAQMRLKRFFDDWVKLIVHPVTRSISYYETYITTVCVSLLDINDKPQYKVELYEAWPKTIGEVGLSYESRDVIRLPVTLEYKNWKEVAV